MAFANVSICQCMIFEVYYFSLVVLILEGWSWYYYRHYEYYEVLLHNAVIIIQTNKYLLIWIPLLKN